MTDWRNRIIKYAEVSPGELTPNPLNWRAHPKQQAAALAGLIETVGWVDDVIVNVTTGNILDGHLRVKLAQERNEPTVPVKYVELSEDEENLVLASFDPITGLAEMDATALAELLGRVDMQAIDDDGLAGLLEELATASGAGGDAGAPVDAEPEIARAEELRQKWGVEPGSLWLLDSGKGHAHRLICGDCTDADVVGRVMGGEKADMVFTDPPYNVASESRNFAADKSRAMDDLKNAEWDKDFDISTLFPVLESVMAKDCAVYVCTSHWLVQKIWEWMWTWSDFCSYNVWCKPNPMPSLAMRHWTWATELIAYAVRGKHISNFPAGEHALNWWAIPKDKDTDHPTEKTLEVVLRPIRFSSNPGMVVFDGFAGSGTTIIAAENLGRRCYAVEISPGYVAVALERFATATGIAPVRIENAPAEAEAVEA